MNDFWISDSSIRKIAYLKPSKLGLMPKVFTLGRTVLVCVEQIILKLLVFEIIEENIVTKNFGRSCFLSC